MVYTANRYAPGDAKNKFRVKGGQDPVYVTGKCRWARTQNPDPIYNKWSVTVWPANTDELAKVQKLKLEGIRNELKKDDDGYYITFSRPIKIETRTGKIIVMEAPVVIDKDSNIVPDLIGDGSDITVKLDVYGGVTDKGKYKAARLESIRVNNLVPYSVKSLDEDTQKRMKGLEEQPEQLF